MGLLTVERLPPMPPLVRLEGWEGRLAEIIEWARSEPYALGRHDCLRVAVRAVQALTGHDHWPHLVGRYATSRQALRLIGEYGRTFEEAFSWLFGVPPSPIAQARRGDVCRYEDVEEHLGVCVGAHVAVLKADGLAFAPLLSCGPCWRIG